MSEDKEILYMKGDRNVEVTHRDVTLGDIMSFECSHRRILTGVKAIPIVHMPENGPKRCVISVLKIISCIHEMYPELEIQNLGETDLIVTYENQQTPGKVVHLIKTAAVSMITFTGAAFSIMTFNNDVSVTKLFSQIYEVIMGHPGDGFTVLEVSYSVGITIGILVFFNHFGKKRFSADPTPLEVQMRLYENDIQATLVENASRKGEELDVGQTDSVDIDRP